MTRTLFITPEPTPLKTGADGVVRVGRTRVTVDTIVYAFEEGATAEEITQQYPALHLAEVYATIAYYLRRRPEVIAYLQWRQQQASVIRQQNESRFDPYDVRSRLMARRRESQSSMELIT